MIWTILKGLIFMLTCLPCPKRKQLGSNYTLLNPDHLSDQILSPYGEMANSKKSRLTPSAEQMVQTCSGRGSHLLQVSAGQSVNPGYVRRELLIELYFLGL